MEGQLRLAELRADQDKRERGGYYAANVTTGEVRLLIEAVEAAQRASNMLKTIDPTSEEAESLLALDVALAEFDFRSLEELEREAVEA